MEKSDVAPWLHVGTQQPHPRCTRQPCLAHCVTGPWRYMKLFWAGVTSAASIKMSSSSLHWIRTLRVRDGVIVWVASTSSQSSSHPSRHRHWVSKVTYIFMLFSFFIEVFFNSWQRTNTVVTVLCRAVDHTCVAVQSPSSLSSALLIRMSQSWQNPLLAANLHLCFAHAHCAREKPLTCDVTDTSVHAASGVR